ncbi:MAG: imidazoleglycerol-phosphate dehydratase HisB [Balneolaceae bacterium]|nr:MAG: imidazoleglycerol-phosphate dehydratase HisB [Balneolaceae bacterium]
MSTIRISAEAVTGPDANPLPGVITSLHDLQKAGFTFLSGALPPGVSALLQNEGIAMAEPGNDVAPVEFPVITTDGVQLVYRSSDAVQHFDNWNELAAWLITPPRTATVKRNTRETRISVDLNLDGTGQFTCQTGLGFFDHMLEQIARHGEIDLNILCDGDLHIDEHHTVEDVALALGTALDQAFGNRRGIERYGFVLPMDESRATVALDLSGRPYLLFEAGFTRDKVGDLPTEMVKHFFYSLAMNLRATLHFEVKGENDHHMIEACFKGFAKCLKAAKLRTGTGIPSSKGVL